MSQERYLQIKKEYRVRQFLVIFLFIIFAILDILLVSSRSRYVPLLTTAMATLVPFNHFFLVPFWRQKKAIEEEHPEWKELSTKGVKVSSSESESSSSFEMKESSSSESKASSSTEKGSKTESSETRPSKSESNNSYYQIPGLTDEQVRDIVSKSVKDLKEQESKEKSEE